MGDGGMSQSATALKERRIELDITQQDVATELARQDDGYFGVARGTIGHYLGEWERGETEPSEEDLERYAAALDAIETRRNESEPDCANPECNTDSDFERVETADGPLCQVCYYTREVEPLNSVAQGGDAQ